MSVNAFVAAAQAFLEGDAELTANNDPFAKKLKDLVNEHTFELNSAAQTFEVGTTRLVDNSSTFLHTFVLPLLRMSIVKHYLIFTFAFADLTVVSNARICG